MSNDLLKDIEKTPLSSKKFIAWFLASMTWKAFLFYAVFVTANITVQLWIIALLFFLDALYVGGQAAVDALVRYVAIVKDTQIVSEHKDDKGKKE